MKWNNLTRTEDLTLLQQESKTAPIVIFKHSTRCSISRAALDRLERQWNDTEMQSVKAYFLDLLSYREISDQITRQFDVVHESPQVLVIQHGKVIFHRSHLAINYTSIKEATIKS